MVGCVLSQLTVNSSTFLPVTKAEAEGEAFATGKIM